MHACVPGRCAVTRPDTAPEHVGCRHAAYVPHGGAEGFNKYLLTLLAQRRELHTQQLNQALHGDTSAANAAAAAQLLVYGNVSNSAIDAERQALQHELTLGLQVAQPALTSEALKDAVQSAGNPLAGEQGSFQLHLQQCMHTSTCLCCTRQAAADAG